MRHNRNLTTWPRTLLPIALCGALLLGGCIAIPVGGDTPSVRDLIMPKGADHPVSTPATSTPTTGSVGAMVGTWQKAGSWKVVVARTRETAKGPGGATAGKGKRFMIVEVEFKNDKLSESLLVNPNDFTLRDAMGKKVAMVGRRVSGYSGVGMREIGPGYGGWTMVAYRIPKGSAGYTFTFAPKVQGKRAKLQWGVP